MLRFNKIVVKRFKLFFGEFRIDTTFGDGSSVVSKSKLFVAFETAEYNVCHTIEPAF